jgi:hypothetical protein
VKHVNILYLSALGVFGAAKGYKTKGGKVDVERDARPTLPLLPPLS